MNFAHDARPLAAGFAVASLALLVLLLSQAG